MELKFRLTSTRTEDGEEHEINYYYVFRVN